MADPLYEPSAQDLLGLSTEAFANVEAANVAAMTKLRAEIVRLSQQGPTPEELRARIAKPLK